MKTLILARHAKSSWKYIHLNDFDRPLKQRGRKNAPMMGKRLLEMGIKPDLIISSPAVRAFTTAQLFAEQLGYPQSRIQTDDLVYGATDDELLKVIHRIDDQYNTVFLFGHNPGFTDLANFLTSEYIENIPTAGVVAISFETDSWKDASPQNSQFKFFDFPKSMAKEDS